MLRAVHHAGTRALARRRFSVIAYTCTRALLHCAAVQPCHTCQPVNILLLLTMTHYAHVYVTCIIQYIYNNTKAF